MVPEDKYYSQIFDFLRPHPARGFTLVEVLVAVALAGLLAAMIAGVMSRGILASEALLEHGEEESEKIVLRRILHRDFKAMDWGSGLEPTPEGFRLYTGHNMLLSSPLPVEVVWSFEEGEIVRREESPDLTYSREQTLYQDMDSVELEFLSLRDERWIPLDSWIRAPDRLYPRAVRLKLDFTGQDRFEIVEHLPL